MAKKPDKKKAAVLKAKKSVNGRPSKKTTIDLKIVEKLSEKGLTDEQLAAVLNIRTSTLYNYKNSWPEFVEALDRGKAVADGQVVRSLFERACGYSCPEERVLSYEGRHTGTVRITKYYPPDTTAAIFWLKNRRPTEWRDKHDIEHTGKIDRDFHIKDASEKDLDGILRSIITEVIARPETGDSSDSGRKV